MDKHLKDVAKHSLGVDKNKNGFGQTFNGCMVIVQTFNWHRQTFKLVDKHLIGIDKHLKG